MASTSISVTSFCSTYDVFLSFRGKDVMKGFTGHLCAALRRSGINTYVEEEKMEDTEKIGAACLNGIQKSKFSLVLLSKDYASSTWCLEELVQILKYKKADDVWPIFYDVDTSHVEEIQGSYKEAFVEHEKHFKEDVLQKWKDALRQVSTLKGLDLPKRLDGHEAKNIDHIVEEISRRLNRTMLNVAIHPIGLQSRAEGMISLMANESLKELNMSGCSKFKELPEDLGKLKSLVVLNLDGTGINILPETIRNMKNLEILSLSECPLIFSPENCPQIISILPFSLKELDIRYCNILDGIIPHAFRGLSSLKVLKLCGNGFTSFPASIISLPNLGQLHLNSCKGLRSIPQLQSSVKGLYANDCLSLESINLTNFHGESALEVKGCVNLKGIEGFFNLEPLEVDIAGKLLGSNSSFIQESVTNYSVRKIDNLVVANAMCPPQALSERGLYSIFLQEMRFQRGSAIYIKAILYPFTCLDLIQVQSSLELLHMLLTHGEDIKRPPNKQKSCYTCPCLTITNKTKLFEWIYDPHITFFSRDVEQDISWLCYWMFDNHKRGTDQYDAGWRFKDELEEGDEVEFSIDWVLELM
ncbi:hypothetical protein GH714_016891 [Hevea brasiliensis]|uniref:TIR domain-containing protein n=1 Tax=Hevea brasiliensis TaxID=3981 RepID=A0A6A6LCJ6_HEVBR|nr:hypothetical protein GH714_016891 [Hevea brasiliensis]